MIEQILKELKALREYALGKSKSCAYDEDRAMWVGCALGYQISIETIERYLRIKEITKNPYHLTTQP